MNRTSSRLAVLPALVAVLFLAACGGSDGRSVSPEAPADPGPPLTYPVDAGPVPGWLGHVRPLEHGRWVNAQPSPDDRTLLAQWLAECEIPIAYFVSTDTRTPRPVARAGAPVETVAVGWNDDGRAGVFFTEGACGAGDAQPGLYLVSLDGEREFVTAKIDEIERWQSTRQ